LELFPSAWSTLYLEFTAEPLCTKLTTAVSTVQAAARLYQTGEKHQQHRGMRYRPPPTARHLLTATGERRPMCEAEHCGQCAACPGSQGCTCCCDQQCGEAGDCCWDFPTSACAAGGSAPFTVFQAAPAQPTWPAGSALALPLALPASSPVRAPSDIKRDAALRLDVPSVVSQAPPGYRPADQQQQQQQQQQQHDDWIDDWSVPNLPQPAAAPRLGDPGATVSGTGVQLSPNTAVSGAGGVVTDATATASAPSSASSSPVEAAAPSGKDKPIRWGSIAIVFVAVCGGVGLLMLAAVMMGVTRVYPTAAVPSL
jgi:hypothetical protein